MVTGTPDSAPTTAVRQSVDEDVVPAKKMVFWNLGGGRAGAQTTCGHEAGGELSTRAWRFSSFPLLSRFDISQVGGKFDRGRQPITR